MYHGQLCKEKRKKCVGKKSASAVSAKSKHWFTRCCTLGLEETTTIAITAQKQQQERRKTCFTFHTFCLDWTIAITAETKNNNKRGEKLFHLLRPLLGLNKWHLLPSRMLASLGGKEKITPDITFGGNQIISHGFLLLQTFSTCVPECAGSAVVVPEDTIDTPVLSMDNQCTDSIVVISHSAVLQNPMFQPVCVPKFRMSLFKIWVKRPEVSATIFLVGNVLHGWVSTAQICIKMMMVIDWWDI